MTRVLSAGRLHREKRGNQPARWVLDWTDAQGRRRRQVLSTDRSVAERMRIELVRKRDLELAGLGAEIGQSRPVHELVEAFLADLSVRATPEHLRNVRAHLKHFFEDVRVERVRDLAPHKFLTHRAKVIAAGVGRETMNHRLRALKCMLNWGVVAALIAVNPLAQVKPLPVGEKHSRRLRRALSDWEIARLLAAADEDDRLMQERLAASKTLGGGSKGARWANLQRPERIPQAPFFRALLSTGARYGELTSATWSDVNLHERTLTLRGETTKAGRTRVLPLRADLVRELVTLKETHERVLGEPGPRVFTSPEGLPWPAVSRNALRVLHRIMQRAGIARRDDRGHVIDIHALRHSYASQLARRGVGLAIAQRLLGHADVSMTAKVYTHVDLDTLRDAVEHLDTTPARGARAVGNT